MRMLFALIGYLATATVLSLALGFVYLWNSGRLDDEKTFQIVALLHDVDLDAVGADSDPIDEQPTPPEELSLEQSRVHHQITMRDYEVKEALLSRNRAEFKHWFDEFRDMRDKLDRLAQKLQEQISEEGDALLAEAIEEVVQQLESIDPAIAKNQLRRTLKESGGMQTVISLMNAMEPEKLKKILKSFATDEELADLHEIHREMLRGGGQKELFDSYRDELKTLDIGS